MLNPNLKDNRRAGILPPLAGTFTATKGAGRISVVGSVPRLTRSIFSQKLI